MSQKFIQAEWLTPEEFNKKLENARMCNRETKIDCCGNRVNLTITNYNYTNKKIYSYKNRYSVDLVNGEKPVISNKAWIASMFKKIVPVIEEGYGRKEIPAPTFDMPGHTKIMWDYLDPGNFSYINDEYILKKIKCYSYDLNSAYSFAMLKPMPDTSSPKFNTIVGPGEIGFRKNSLLIPVVTEGKYADVVFKLVESPYKDFVYKYFNLKEKEPHGSENRVKYKEILNMASGLLHRYNIFHRLMVLYYAKIYIQQFMDENTVYCNVDSIVSLTERNDLPISNNIGEFKLEHNGDMFKFKQVAIYQWCYDWGNEVHYSGVKRNSIKDIEDIKDANKFNNNYYYDNKEGYIWPIKDKIEKQVNS